MRSALATRLPLASLPALVAVLAPLALAACSGGGGSSSPAGLAITITGLPPGLAAAVTVTGPGGFSRTVTAGETLAGVADGDYLVTAAAVSDPGLPGLGRGNGGTLGPASLQRHPLVPAQHVAVSGGRGAAAVRYPAPTLTVAVPVAGSPGVTVPLELVLVPAGSFLMGSDVAADNPVVFVNAQPPHQVTFEKAFYLARTETTQAQWLAVMPSNPSLDQSSPERPVEQVSWDQLRGADGFLERLAAAVPALPGFRLPSEAEWEYATRAGTTTGYFFYPDPAPLYEGEPPSAAFVAFAAALDGYAVWGADWRGVTTTAPVASRAPNAWGLHDLAGNVIEWTEDDGHAGYGGAPADGSAWVDAPSRGATRIQRGGSFFNYEDLCRSAVRTEQLPTPPSPEKHVGFRVALPVPAGG
jgi:formylglycine-generating enzyme required for sulfatase activity